jgi:hypothetical protein
MRRTLTAVAVSAACSFAAVTTVAQASTAAPQAGRFGPSVMKAPKAKSYTHCEEFFGCGEIPWLIYPKTKTWEFEGYGETEYSGTYEKVGNYSFVFHYSHGSTCELVAKRKKKNYVGHDAGAGCGEQGVELRFNG